jgi:hypothetical protein
MAQCKLCDRSGWFLSLSSNDLCNSCESFFQLDLHQRVRVIQESQEIVKASMRLDTKLSRIQVAIDHLRALQNYERRGIETVQPPPAEAISQYERRRQEEVFDHAKMSYDEALAKAELIVSGKSKTTILSKELLKLRDYAQYAPSNLQPMAEHLKREIAKATMVDYLEKARKAEFKGQQKKALEQYYEALYFLKHDEVDDSLQTEHITVLERKIVELGGSLNYQAPPPPISPSPPAASFPNDDVLEGYRFSAALQLVTPTAVLQHHRELRPGPVETLPSYGTQDDGIWLPEVKSWTDLVGESGTLEMAHRLDAVESDEPMIVATDIGPQPNDGQEYCKFLLAFRRIIESTVQEDDKDRLVQQLLDTEPTCRAFAEKHDRNFVKNWRRIIARQQSKRTR